MHATAPSAAPSLLVHALRALFLAAGLACAGGCSGAKTPADQMAAADEAVRSGDTAEALAGYERLLTWDGEGTVDAKQRFKASLESVKCLIALGRTGEALERYRGMGAAFPDEMRKPDAYKTSLAVIDALTRANAEPKDLVAVLEVAKKEHPGNEDQFKSLVERLAKEGGAEVNDALKGLGYL